MAKLSYANLKLKTNTNIKTFNIDENTIEVLQFLPIQDKYDLIMITLQECKEDKLYNPIKLEEMFKVNIVYMYTNLYFTDKQKSEPEKIYNTLKSNGILDEIISNIPANEYLELVGYLDKIIENEMKYSLSMSAIIANIINDLPKQAQAMADIMNTFDENKYKNVMNLANAVGYGNKVERAE